MSQRLILRGKDFGYIKTVKMEEQVPINLNDIINQKKRWMRGALEGLHNYSYKFLSSKISLRKKVTWAIVMATPFFSILLFPYLPLYLFVSQIWQSSKHKDPFASIMGIVFLFFLNQLCGLMCLVESTFNLKSSWKNIRRIRN